MSKRKAPVITYENQSDYYEFEIEKNDVEKNLIDDEEEVQLILIFATNPFIFCIARLFRQRLQPIFRQFVNLINHNKYNDTLDEI